MNVTDFRRGEFHCFWVTVRERAMAKGYNINMRNAKYPCFCRRSKLSRKGVHSEKVRETGRR